jgi:CheY-like chemotaxis protein
MRRVLVVTASEERREAIASALEGDDHDVTCCPGPVAPSYVCIGGRGGRCPLVAVADLVVLDGTLASDEAEQGTRSCELLRYYLSARRPVVTLIDPVRGVAAFPSGQIVALRRDATARAVVDAVRWIAEDDGSEPPAA